MIHSKALDRDKIPTTMDEWKAAARTIVPEKSIVQDSPERSNTTNIHVTPGHSTPTNNINQHL